MHEEQIREIAYLNYLNAGSPEGRSLEFWVDAEHQFYTGAHTIYVTQTDIDHGKRCNIIKCPIAMAIARCTRQWVAVGSGIACFWDSVSQLPIEAINTIQWFDLGREILPFKFYIAL